MKYHTAKVKRYFYKYFNEDTETIQWLNVSPCDSVSGLVYMNDFITVEEEPIQEWNYNTFMSNLLNTSV